MAKECADGLDDSSPAGRTGEEPGSQHHHPLLLLARLYGVLEADGPWVTERERGQRSERETEQEHERETI